MNQSAQEAAVVQHAVSAVKKPHLAFIGTGWIGLNRMKAIAASNQAEICAILEPRREMAFRAMELAPDAEVVSSMEEIERAGADGVVIATPSAMHAQQAIELLQRGLAVFCQKPLGINGAQTREVIETARVGNRLLGVDLCYRHVDGFRKIKELVRSGELGEIVAIELIFHNAYGPDKPWFYDRKLSGGGCLIDLGIHLVDMALWLTDFPRIARVSGDVFVHGHKQHCASDDVEVEDFAVANMSLEQGTSVNLACSWKAHAGQDAVVEASVYGTKGGAKLRNINGSFFDFTAEHYVGTARKTIAVPPDEWGGRAAMDWLSRLCKSNRFDSSIQNLATVADVLDHIYQS
jgi:predicted dehydrogenase